MATIPIDIKEVLNASGITAKEQAEPVRVAIFVDIQAQDLLVSAIRRAFTPLAPNAFLHIESFGDTEVLPMGNEATDLALVVSGTSREAILLANSLHNQEIPTLSVCMSLREAMEIADLSGYPLLLADTIPFIKAADEELQACEKDFLSAVGKWIVERCHKKRLGFAAAFSFIRQPLCVEITKATAFQNGAIGAVLFIPGADMPVMTLNQTKMILQIAAAYGEELGVERVKELAVVVGGGFAFRTIARELVGVVPALGWAIKAGIGYSGTIAMGYAAIEYFEGGGSFQGVAAKAAAARDAAMERVHLLQDKRQVSRDSRAQLRQERKLLKESNSQPAKEKRELEKLNRSIKREARRTMKGKSGRESSISEAPSFEVVMSDEVF